MTITKLKRTACVLTALLMAVSALGLGGCKGKDDPQEAEPTQQAVETEHAEPAGEGYAERLFDASRVHEIDISIEGSDWEDLKANPLLKTKYRVSITIDGETVNDVSFSTKGNTSLSSIAMNSQSDRYSFKVNFGKYVKGQTYRGLNKLNLNNIYADATYMKDYLSYEISRRAGVNAPLTSYVWLTVNGEAHGLYIAIEDLENGEGELYKPESDRLDNIADEPGGQQGGQ